MTTDLELRQLRYFVVVAEELNFTRAAERLQIAQPPLSRQIQGLEKALGVDLLERTNRRVALTAAGQVFLSECRQILAHLDRTVRNTQRAAQGETGQLVVGFEGSVHNDVVLKTIRKFRHQCPDVELIVQEMPSGRQLEGLHKGRLDLGFVEPIMATADVVVEPLIAEPLIVALAETHPLADHKQLTLTQLAQESWITGRSDEGCGLLVRILAACRQAGFTPKVQQETNDPQMMLGLVAASLGVTLLPTSARSFFQTGVTYRPLQPPVPEVELAIAWHSGNQSPVLRAFLQTIQVSLAK
ncbi:MAG: LysR family transcriptional regulator [Leptolyngbya sp. RL_3_1]|nr:LysR family transcriptional regulator [Leptolyngbya sp. RL_3_1]